MQESMIGNPAHTIPDPTVSFNTQNHDSCSFYVIKMTCFKINYRILIHDVAFPYEVPNRFALNRQEYTRQNGHDSCLPHRLGTQLRQGPPPKNRFLKT